MAEEVVGMHSVAEGAEEVSPDVPSQGYDVGLGARVPAVMSKSSHSSRLSYVGTLRFTAWNSKADASSVGCSLQKTFSGSLYGAQAWLLITLTGLQEAYLHLRLFKAALFTTSLLGDS